MSRWGPSLSKFLRAPSVSITSLSLSDHLVRGIGVGGLKGLRGAHPFLVNIKRFASCSGPAATSLCIAIGAWNLLRFV